MEEENNGNLSIISEIEISYRPIIKASSRPKILQPEDAYKLFIQTWDKSKMEFVEEFKVMLLNRGKKVLGISTLTRGSVSGTVVDPKLVFVVALKANATEIILAHNHPSGNVSPSTADKEITSRLRTIGVYLDLHIADHLIISSEGFYSFALEGVL